LNIILASNSYQAGYMCCSQKTVRILDVHIAVNFDPRAPTAPLNIVLASTPIMAMNPPSSVCAA